MELNVKSRRAVHGIRIKQMSDLQADSRPFRFYLSVVIYWHL